MKIKNLLSTIAILSIVLFTGCAKDDFVEVLGECPIVNATSPVDGAFSVPLSKTITATFNKEMNARFDGVRDYIVCHYKANQRKDTDYWKDKYYSLLEEHNNLIKEKYLKGK